MKNKMKRIILIVIIMLISITYASTNKKNRNIGDAIQVTSLPVSGKTVVLDAGHGTPDERC